MKSFEECINYIENKISCELLNYQKQVLRNEYEGKHYCYHFGRISGKYMLYCAILILKEFNI